jgi:endonuclease/exonuclease/phosphatase family metal-dependent hydrolase
MKVLAGGALALVVALTGLATEGAAAVTRPSQVKDVTIVAASTSSLTLRWPAATGADAYQVEFDTGLDMAHRRLAARTDATSYTLSGLRPGETYCFQVRGISGRQAGNRSQRTCKPTIVAQGPESDVTYRVLTYNLCSAHCADWTTRRAPAVSLMRRPRPDVIALQETARDSGVDQLLANRYTVAARKKAKMLLFRTDRFVMKRSGYLELTGEPGTSHPSHYAVWAELADRAHDGKRVIFTSAHLSAGPDTATGDDHRRSDTLQLLAGVKDLNPDNVPVVYAGDYNSHKHRKFDSPARVMNAAGYWDAFDLAEKLGRPNYNSANQLRYDPVIGDTWGDHVDHVWVEPGTSRILSWRSVADLTSSGRYAAPLPSNHNPVYVKVAVG